MCERNHDSKKKVSIVVLCHNSEATLERCLDSITSQSYQNIEIICIDDFSSDDTAILIKKYARKDNRIIKIKNEKWNGIMESRIKGIDCASGDYICFIDSDDEVCNDYIEMLLQNSLKNESDVVYSKVCVVNSKDSLELHPLFNEYLAKEDLKKQFVESYGKNYQWYVVWGKMYKKDILKNVLPTLSKLNKIQMCEDIIINSAILNSLECATMCECTTYYYHVNTNTGITSSPSTVLQNIKYINDVKKAIKFLSNNINLSKYDMELWKKYFNEVYNKRIDSHPYNFIIKSCLKIHIKMALHLAVK